MSSDPKLLHPCERVFGECAGGDECRFKNAPREACLANLKGRCKYGERCNELHVTMYKDNYVPELHPCLRIFGSCRYGDECEFKNLPALTCIKFLRGKCVNGARCEEIHLARGGAQATAGAYGGYQMAPAPVYGGIGVKRSRDDSGADGEKRQRQQQQQQQQQFQTYLNPYMDPQTAMANYYYAAAYTTTPAVPKTHPCLRIFGSCRHGQSCRYINYPFEACLQHLRGKCRFKDACNELHCAIPGSGGSGYAGGGSSRSTKPTSNDMNSLHPCFRIYGSCRDGEACPYARYPQHYCLQHLKGRCKFGDRCNEFHATQSEIDGGSPGEGPPGEE